MSHTAQERAFELYEGYALTAKHWSNPEGIPTIALHGWLDNAGSFDRLSAHLPMLDLVALDLPGHGHSSHKSPMCFFHILDFVIEVFKVADLLGWESFTLLGHSLGAAISSYMAGTYPNRVNQLLLIDGLGALTTPAHQAPNQLQLYLDEISKQKGSSKPPVYPDIETAIRMRQQVSEISVEGARPICERGLKAIDGGLTWRTDPRLLKPSAVQLTNEQNEAFLRRIQCPGVLIRPEPGFPFNDQMMNQRYECVKEQLDLVTTEGHHHVHCDRPEAVAQLLIPFIESA